MMKKIIIATDFFDASQNALHYGAWLAKQVGASILLAHVYQVPVTTNDIPIMALPIREMKESTDAGLEKIRADLQKDYPDLAVETAGKLGLVSDEINDLCKEHHAFAVVMGSNNSSSLERMLFGSTTSSVVRHAVCPVIAVPEAYKNFSIERIVLATDLQNLQQFPSKSIIEIVQHFNANLHIVYINKEEGKDAAMLLEQLKPVTPVYEQINNENVNEGINEYVKNTGADLLILLPHDHNLIERLFFKLHTEDIIAHVPIPVLSIRG